MAVDSATGDGYTTLDLNDVDIGENKTIFQAFSDATGYDADAHTRMFLGELGFGKEVYDSRAAAGLNAYMQINGYDEEVDHAVLAGGLFPEFPFLYSKNNAERMRYLATDERKDSVPESERLAEEVVEAITSEEHAEHYEEFVDKWLEGKLTTWEMVKSYSEWQIETIFDGVDVDRIDYCQGDEDQFNRKEKEEILVNELSKEAKKYRDQIESEIDEMEDEKDRHEDELSTLEKEYEAIKDINQRVSGHLNANDPDVEQFIEDYIIGSYTIFREMTGEERNNMERMLQEVDDADDFAELYDRIEEGYEEEKEQVETYEDRLDSLEDKLNGVKRQIEQGDEITAFTKRAYIEPHEAEWLYKRVKDEYTDDIIDVFPEELQEETYPHISRWAHVDDQSSELLEDEQAGHVEDLSIDALEDSDADSYTLEEADVAVYGDIMVMHNTKFRSDTTTLKGLQEAEQELLYRKLMDQVTSDDRNELPRLIVTSHPSGGFSWTRINTAQDFRFLDGGERDTPEVPTAMTLPTFHSTEELLDFKDKGMQNDETKRTDKHIHQEGAVFQTVLDDGSEMYHHLGTQSLIELGEKYWELQDLEEGSQAYEEKWAEMEEMCRIYPKVRMVISDAHWGAANWSGVPSTHERTIRPLNYLGDTYGEADFENKQLVFGGDLINGDLKFTGDEYKQYADTVPELRDDLKEEIAALNAKAENGELSADDIADELEDAIDTLTESMEGMPFTHRNKQLDMASEYLPAFVEETDPSEIVVISGDHDGKSGRNPNTDEAGDIVARLPDSFDDDNIIVSDSIGSSHGGYGGVKDETVLVEGEEFDTGRTILYHHRVPAGKTSDTRTKRKMKRSGYLPDEYVAGHIHHARGGVWDGVEETVGRSLKAQDDYGEHLPVNSPLYGTVIKWANAAPEGHEANGFQWSAWHDVADNTLEQDEFMGDELDKELEELEENVASLA